jgi:hypothetical protein
MRLKASCIVCMPLEKALESYFVCRVCVSTKTRAAQCQKCCEEMKGSASTSFEALVLMV